MLRVLLHRISYTSLAECFIWKKFVIIPPPRVRTSAKQGSIRLHTNQNTKGQDTKTRTIIPNPTRAHADSYKNSNSSTPTWQEEKKEFTLTSVAMVQRPFSPMLFPEAYFAGRVCALRHSMLRSTKQQYSICCDFKNCTLMYVATDKKQNIIYLTTCALASLRKPGVSQVLIIIHGVGWGIRPERKLLEREVKKKTTTTKKCTNETCCRFPHDPQKKKHQQ